MILIINNKFGAWGVMRCPLVSLVKWDKNSVAASLFGSRKGASKAHKCSGKGTRLALIGVRGLFGACLELRPKEHKVRG